MVHCVSDGCTQWVHAMLGFAKGIERMASFASSDANASKLSAVLRETKMLLFEYVASSDTLRVFDERLAPKVVAFEFLKRVEQGFYVAEDDEWKVISFFSGKLEGAVEVRVKPALLSGGTDVVADAGVGPVEGAAATGTDSTDVAGGISAATSADLGSIDVAANPPATVKEAPAKKMSAKEAYRTVQVGIFQWPASGRSGVLEGYVRDITEEKQREGALKQLAQRDALTLLYNQATGRSLVDEYLAAKTPYASCGIVVIDIDFFKSANDSYGHQFGDEVLVQMAQLLSAMFRRDDVVMRIGGDEFAVFLRDITCPSLVKKVQQLVEAAREITFPGRIYSFTCSVGACFLPENTSGFTFDQLFCNADWALYRAKENGRNRYELCDGLQRFDADSGFDFDAAVASNETNRSDIDTRYLHGDIVSVAFEIFEKANNFNEAMSLFLKIVGRRFSLDRITVIQTDIKKQSVSRRAQWVSSDEFATLDQPGGFSKKDFLALFHSYDEQGTAVVHYDDTSAYSSQGAALLIQGQAKTVLYAAMFSEGSYIGAVSYATCDAKRFWSKQDRAVAGELAKIIAAHLSRHQALNVLDEGINALAAYDSLTGLLSFHRFREEVERSIVGGFAIGHVVAYVDFTGFGEINSEYGFGVGDKLIKEFGDAVASAVCDNAGVLFSRVAADNFILFCPCDNLEAFTLGAQRFGAAFEQEWQRRYPKVKLGIRSGLYRIGSQCVSAAAAVDAASFARTQIAEGSPRVLVYDENVDMRRQFDRDLVGKVDDALGNGQIVVYLQPIVRIADWSVVAAEALVRWVQKDGSVLLPRDFVPLCEKAGKVRDVDLHVLDRVASFLVHCKEAYGRTIPISVNAALPFSSNEATPGKYARVLEGYGIDPSLVQVEVSESDVVAAMGEGKNLLRQLRRLGLETALDGFGEDRTSLKDLIEAPLSSIKISRSYTNTCMQTKHGRMLLKKTIGLLHGLGFEVICEGVESKEDAHELLDMGCELAQGYFFSQPLPAVEFERLVFGGK